MIDILSIILIKSNFQTKKNIKLKAGDAD